MYQVVASLKCFCLHCFIWALALGGSTNGGAFLPDLCFLLGASCDIFSFKLSQDKVSIFKKETN